MTTKKISKRLPLAPDFQESLCEANKLLLSRMESNPDEFHLTKGGKWADYLNMLYNRVNGDNNVLVMLTDAECEFMWNQYTIVAKANLHKNFMNRLFADKPDSDGPITRFTTTGRFS